LSRGTQSALDAYNATISAGGGDLEIPFSNFKTRITRLSANELNQLREAIFDLPALRVGSRTEQVKIRRRLRLLNLLDAERQARRLDTEATSRTQRRPGLQAKGGVHFDPGFFIVGEGGDGMKRGSAEFAFLAEGSVVAPMKKGEKPTMKNARRAVAEMILHGRRGKDGEPIKKLAHGGVTVVSGDNLWTIIQRLGGDPTRWPEVAKAIGLSDPRRLQIGTLIPFEVLQRVGARVPAPPTPAPAPTTAPAPAPTPAPGLSPEEESLQETVSGIETLLGGPIGELLQSGRSIAELLAGLTLAPSPTRKSAEPFRELVGRLPGFIQSIIDAPGTKFPLQTFEQLAGPTQAATSSVLGSVTQDPNIFQAILGLQRGLRRKAFSGNQQLALTR